MATITVKKNIEVAYLKRKDLPLSELSPSDYRRLPKGSSLKVSGIYPANGQSLMVEISGDSSTYRLKNKEPWFIYQGHFDILGGFLSTAKKPVNPNDIRLKVPYFAQCDSNYEGYRQCFSHSVAMAADCILNGEITRSARSRGYAQPENFYNDIRADYGDTTDNTAHVAALKSLGIDAYFTQTASPKDLYSALKLGIPVPIGVGYKSSGHWICLVGMEDGNYLMNDPYGSRNGASNSYFCNSTDQGKEGAYDQYTPSIMDSIYWDAMPTGGRECGWAIIITSVNGTPTGLPANL